MRTAVKEIQLVEKNSFLLIHLRWVFTQSFYVELLHMCSIDTLQCIKLVFLILCLVQETALRHMPPWQQIRANHNDARVCNMHIKRNWLRSSACGGVALSGQGKCMNTIGPNNREDGRQ